MQTVNALWNSVMAAPRPERTANAIRRKRYRTQVKFYRRDVSVDGVPAWSIRLIAAEGSKV